MVMGVPLLCSVVLKFPCTAAGYGNVCVLGVGMAERQISYDHMKKVLLRPL